MPTETKASTLPCAKLAERVLQLSTEVQNAENHHLPAKQLAQLKLELADVQHQFEAECGPKKGPIPKRDLPLR